MPNDLPERVGAVVSHLRDRVGLTQEEAGANCEGVSGPTASRYEKGDAKDGQPLRKLADYVDGMGGALRVLVVPGAETHEAALVLSSTKDPRFAARLLDSLLASLPQLDDYACRQIADFIAFAARESAGRTEGQAAGKARDAV